MYVCVYVYISLFISLKENNLTLKNKRRQYTAKNITHSEYADYLVLLKNTPVEAKSQLHSLK